MNIDPATASHDEDDYHKYEAELQDPPKEAPPVEVDTTEIHRAAKEREKKQPIVQKLVKKFSGNEGPYREIIINAEPLETRVAQLVDGVLEKYEIERAGEDRIVHSIFKGKIQNLEAGLKAAFVDIGQAKNAFLHYWDILPAANDNSVEIVRDTRTAEQKSKGAKIGVKDIPQKYPIGSDIMVQVTKGQIGTKGPRTTTNISLPGRFLVLMPFAGQCGISKKIENNKERARLREALRSLTIPDGMGVIIRTAGEGKKLRYFVRDLHMLLQKWEEIQMRTEQAKQPCALYHEPNLVERTMRDFLTEDIDRVLIDNAEEYKTIIESVGKISPRSKSKINLFKESIPIFERFNIEPQVEQTYQRRVPLPSGGEIVIEETEALIAIDVNTGSHKQKSSEDASNFILQVNVESAREIARQIRLRNIGGLIILDFIDMKQRKDRNTVLRVMREEMAKDKAKCHILPISQLGIMQMTRQRHEESISKGVYASCHYCKGRGIVKSAPTMSVEIQRRLTSIIRRYRAQDDSSKETLHLRVLCHPSALERLRTTDEEHLVELEDLYNVKLAFRGDPFYHVENFKVINAENNQELR